MIHRSPSSNAFEFVAIAALRAHQLRRGCTQRVPGDFKLTTIAQMEVVAGMVERIPAVFTGIVDPVDVVDTIGTVDAPIPVV